jgi:hypothetical protein
VSGSQQQDPRRDISQEMEREALITEREEYWAMPGIPGQNADGGDVDILKWWKEIGQKKFPHVAVMARQYLGVPASSAIVERIFSFAGLTFSDLRKSLEDTTLEEFMWVRWDE